MFPWVFRATVLTHWTSRQTPTAARVRRAHSAGVSQSNKSCRAFIPFGPRLYVAAARRSVNVAMNFRYGWTLIQNRDPTWYDMYPIMEQFPCIYILIRMVWSISQHIGSCYVDQHVLILILRYICTCGGIWILGQTMVLARGITIVVWHYHDIVIYKYPKKWPGGVGCPQFVEPNLTFGAPDLYRMRNLPQI